MIQRIQSLYLLLAVVAVALLFFFPIAELLVDKEFTFLFRYRGLYELKHGQEILKIASYPLAILFSINMIISLITIFKFKNRILQLRLCIINILLLIASLALAYYFIAFAFTDFQDTVRYGIVALMPVLAAIFSFLAYKGIQKDEKLIKSIDRIR